ncbi:MAG: molybdenum cofactor biosynthesis protein MoaE [Actinomycetota bacterium]|nr:molybdenum cofactor biosynthesis protein MoaE [Actinomycetota bacterium]
MVLFPAPREWLQVERVDRGGCATKVRVRKFGALSESAGSPEEVIEVDRGSTAGDVLRLLGQRHPAVSRLAGQIRMAVNLELASPDQPLQDDDEVALLPPVAGGADILIGLREKVSVDEALQAVTAPEVGGIVIFLGTVRNHAEEWGRVDLLEYSAYQEMAESVLRKVAEEAAQKWPLNGIAILHGVGNLNVGDHTVVVACSSAHRGEAFEACRYAIDELKVRVPIWKKERGPGGERWVGLEEPPEGQLDRDDG